AFDRQGNKHALHALWNRRHTTKFNGVSYPVQRAAEACYKDDGPSQIKALADYYLANAARIRNDMTALGFSCTGGVDSPYIWVNVKTDSWEFFNRLLVTANVVCTPGAGFGRCGEGYVRISAFNNPDNLKKALSRIAKALR
ncbi:MAG: aminotransferase class I/II-fold pyridoxal phosphate-dependent enzyme, partial [Chitinispirillaceae bacterium]|nr:aminotransferase class I/II-fold pyridoxal phosphate-dependent enzyme [Chitinispirillaceae bacterium]